MTAVYKRKGEKVVDLNVRAIEAGEQYVREHFASVPSGYALESKTDGDRLIMMGKVRHARYSGRALRLIREAKTTGRIEEATAALSEHRRAVRRARNAASEKEAA